MFWLSCLLKNGHHKAYVSTVHESNYLIIVKFAVPSMQRQFSARYIACIESQSQNQSPESEKETNKSNSLNESEIISICAFSVLALTSEKSVTNEHHEQRCICLLLQILSNCCFNRDWSQSSAAQRNKLQVSLRPCWKLNVCHVKHEDTHRNTEDWLNKIITKERQLKKMIILPSIPIMPLFLFSSDTSNLSMISAAYSEVTLVICRAGKWKMFRPFDSQQITQI